MSNVLSIRGFGKIQLPTLPAGYRFVVMLPISHNSGDPYGPRVFAVRAVAHFRLPRWGGEPGEMENFRAGTKLIVYSWLDCNGEYEFLLPKRSQEFVDGSWIGRRRAKYDY